MNCPDCKGIIEIELVENMAEVYDRLSTQYIKLDHHYYKCPKCKQEFDPEDLEEA